MAPGGACVTFHQARVPGRAFSASTLNSRADSMLSGLMAAKIRTADGREVTVALSGKRAAEVLTEAMDSKSEPYARFMSPAKSRVWINPTHVTAIEDHPDAD